MTSCPCLWVPQPPPPAPRTALDRKETCSLPHYRRTPPASLSCSKHSRPLPPPLPPPTAFTKLIATFHIKQSEKTRSSIFRPAVSARSVTGGQRAASLLGLVGGTRLCQGLVGKPPVHSTPSVSPPSCGWSPGPPDRESLPWDTSRPINTQLPRGGHVSAPQRLPWRRPEGWVGAAAHGGHGAGGADVCGAGAAVRGLRTPAVRCPCRSPRVWACPSCCGTRAGGALPGLPA